MDLPALTNNRPPEPLEWPPDAQRAIDILALAFENFYRQRALQNPDQKTRERDK